MYVSAIISNSKQPDRILYPLVYFDICCFVIFFVRHIARKFEGIGVTQYVNTI